MTLVSPSLNLVVKVAERCNLACDYCYMYEFDDGWRDRPPLLSLEHAEQLVRRVTEFVEGGPARHVTLELHGGEPLLWGQARFAWLLDRTAALRQAGQVSVCVQTNGYLLTPQWVDLFVAGDVSWSISCDGPARVHDRHRRTHRGDPSWRRVHSAIELSLGHRLFGGVLAVADFDVPACEVLEHFMDVGLTAVDLLLPDRTRVGEPDSRAAPWLLGMLRWWLTQDDRAIDIRFLREFTLGALGHPSSLDIFGGALSEILVIESDGSIQLLDVLRICGTDHATTGWLLADTDLETAARAAGEALPPAPTSCHGCRAKGACGGGYLPHRWDGSTYDNPTVYCAAMLSLYDAVVAELRRRTPAHVWTTTTVACGSAGAAVGV